MGCGLALPTWRRIWLGINRVDPKKGVERMIDVLKQVRMAKGKEVPNIVST
jgi:hypothetical protein